MFNTFEGKTLSEKIAIIIAALILWALNSLFIMIVWNYLAHNFNFAPITYWISMCICWIFNWIKKIGD